MYHSPDLDRVLDRAWESGVQKIIITGGSLSESEEALKLALTDDRLFCTVGCHPTRCDEFEKHPGGPAAYLSALQEILDRGQALKKVVAVGEFGLDYDRLHFCSAETQKKYFEIQLALVCHSGLPMFLHMRAAAQDFAEILSRYYTNAAQTTLTPSCIFSSVPSPNPSSPSPTSSSPSPLLPAFCPSSGVVHSFTGTLDEALSILALHPSLFIGLNGCSLRTQESLSVAAAIPSSRVMLETDCPWCEIKNTHPGKGFIKTVLPVKAVDKKKHSRDAMVKSRNEPSGIRQVLEVFAGAKGIYDGGRTKEEEGRLTEELAEEIYLNTDKVFFSSARV
uniref:TatD related DNase n=1 Tax=Polytomella parva TaxID=51329 RepID=A0A7S0YMN6_9CHLO|mmetsp:Transcript_33545/g.60589  ORF Transcript_33545/g.60589 Transcript_33545/m.60589 type:complete len:335 (+) Transcript_33545:180-1184(+)